MDIELNEWVRANPVRGDMIWKGAAADQVNFIFYNLRSLISDDRSSARVISTHRSKSIELPVCSISNEALGIRFVMRYNFYNWKLSVISETPIIVDGFDKLFHTTPPADPSYTGDDLHPVYFEGFPSDLIFGYYETSDKKRWSCQIGNDYQLWTVVFMIMNSLGGLKSFFWHTRETHRAELDAQREARNEESK